MTHYQHNDYDDHTQLSVNYDDESTLSCPAGRWMLNDSHQQDRKTTKWLINARSEPTLSLSVQKASTNPFQSIKTD